MPYFTKKPITVEAIQFDGSVPSYHMIIKAFPDLTGVVKFGHQQKGICIEWFKISNDSGAAEVSKDDWVIKGTKGEYYPCKPDIFQQIYEPADTKEEEPATLSYDISKAMWVVKTATREDLVSLSEAAAMYKKGVALTEKTHRFLAGGIIPPDHDIRWF
jgi:hypothetical protein